MRSLFCMAAAIVLAAGVSARADVVGPFNVSGISDSIRISDPILVDVANRVSEPVGAFYSPVDAANANSPVRFICSLADGCDGSFGADSLGTNERDTSSALPLQASSVTRGAEPSSVALLGTGLLGFAAVMRRRFPA